MSATELPASAPAQPTESGFRFIAESLVALALAVMLVRTFAVEGYIISTGSMAPFLLGYHKQVVCPDCRFPFAVGVPVDEDHPTGGPVACPNCGQSEIHLEHVPRNEGDQLLVQKLAYLFRQPKRWEVVVFQNPSRPTQAYVKRVIGLPGERIQVQAGDVLINDELVRKSLSEQRSTRIPICSQQHCPAHAHDFRWEADTGWQSRPNGFELEPPSASQAMTEDTSPAELSWVAYRGSAPKRNGAGSTVSSPSAQAWPADDYAYNGLTEPITRYLVRDLMVSFELELQRGRGEFAVAMSDGRQSFEVRLAAGERELRLFVDDAPEPADTAQLSGSIWRRPMLVEMSLFDRQLLFAVNGETVFVQKLSLRANDNAAAQASATVSSPVRFGGRDLRAFVREVTLYRDVYYTRGDGRNGVKEPYALGEDEYFFLGDNSPVSLDSRSWTDGVVHEHMLIGKPFLVHLPSRPGRIKVGSAEWHIRVPDWGRIRYIR